MHATSSSTACNGDICNRQLIVQYFAQVQGQVADLTDLQRILQRSEQKLSNAQQQNMTVCCCRCTDPNVVGLRAYSMLNLDCRS